MSAIRYGFIGAGALLLAACAGPGENFRPGSTVYGVILPPAAVQAGLVGIYSPTPVVIGAPPDVRANFDRLIRNALVEITSGKRDFPKRKEFRDCDIIISFSDTVEAFNTRFQRELPSGQMQAGNATQFILGQGPTFCVTPRGIYSVSELGPA